MRKSCVSLKKRFTNKVICLSLESGPDLSSLVTFFCEAVFSQFCVSEGLPGVLMGISVKMRHQGQATSLPNASQCSLGPLA